VCGFVNFQPTKVAILGAGKGGTALLGLFSQIPGIEIIGIADKDRSAPGLKLARRLMIPVEDRVTDLITNDGVNLIVDVTGDPPMTRVIAEHKHPGVEILGGAAAKLLWNLIQYQSTLQGQLFETEKLAAIGSFAAGIAHDINNPLHLILAFAEQIREEHDAATIRQHADEIIGAVRQINAISKDLTQYARRSTATDAVAVDLNQKLDEALKIARYAAVLHDLSVVKQYADAPVVKANPEEMLHVFVNLITNAVQAMDDKGTLTLATHCEDTVVTAAISDTGCGIPTDSLDRIFDPLFTTKPPEKGTGLGLHNVRVMVQKHGGTISVESEVGKGTTFHLLFPRATPPAERAA
jgi:signal transduction histidine kinase